MGNDAELKEKLKALLAAEHELREALEGFDEDIDADLLNEDLPDSLDEALARVPRLERWSDLLRDLRSRDRMQIPDGVDKGQYFDRR